MDHTSSIEYNLLTDSTGANWHKSVGLKGKTGARNTYKS